MSHLTKIRKSRGQTPTEESLAQLCDRTFLKLWSYANPYKSAGKELCDLIAIFENHVFLFFARHSTVLETGKDIAITWERWKRAVIDRQITTADGAQRHITRNPDAIFLDAKCTVRLPIKIPSDNLIIHKLIVAHGAKEACEAFSEDNVSGSLGIAYTDNQEHKFPFPFMVSLRRVNPVHVLDSYNLAIILGELDTFYDFVCYLSAKEEAISRFQLLGYCGGRIF